MGLLTALLLIVQAAVAADLPRVTDCAECPEMIVVPAGRFIMGAAGQKPEFGPPVDVAIERPFALATTEISFDAYRKCVDVGACRGMPDDHGWGRGQQPVVNVSWDDANGYAAWLNRLTKKKYRLPSEAEWEYAARAGTVTPYPWGTDTKGGHANCRDCGSAPWGGDRPAPVGSFPANQFGFRDLLGNVSEWVADCWFDRHARRDNAQDPRGPAAGDSCERRVTRGGDWYYIPPLATSAARMSNVARIASYTIGFRVARDAEPGDVAGRK